MILFSAILCSIWVTVLNAQVELDTAEGFTEESAVFPTTFSPRFGSNKERSSYDKCGVKGPNWRSTEEEPEFTSDQVVFEKDDKDQLENTTEQEKFSLTNDEEGSIVRLTEDSQINKFEPIDSDAAITSLDWAVPSLDDTVFAEYAGEENPFNSRITYGQETGSREFPWQVAITLYGKFHCGASLISDSYVLTAAHCVYYYDHVPSLLDLTLGDWDLKSSTDGKSLKAKVSRVSVYPGYARKTLKNDIAVLKLAERVEFTDRIRPICLPTFDINLDGGEAIVTGWGRNEAKQLETKLHSLRANIISNEICGERWKGLIVPSMMCMDSTSGDACNADSGGPSISEYPAGSGSYVQVGIVSFGSGSCTDSNLPGVYTRVAHFSDWIREQMY